MSYIVPLLVLPFLLGCNDTRSCPSTSLINDGIETLCVIERYDEALRIYDNYIISHPDLKDYLNTKSGLKLFSNTNRHEDFIPLLKKHLEKGGDKEKVHFHIDREFYHENMATIDSMMRHNKPSIVSASDSLIIEEFIFVDQDIRKNRKGSREERRLKDSINQIKIQNLLSEKKYTNYQIEMALSLLLRHCSSDYLKTFKTTGLLEFYTSNGVITNEEYYSAIEYRGKDIYTNRKEFSSQDMLEALNDKRRKVDLLPMRYSPCLLYTSPSPRD